MNTPTEPADKLFEVELRIAQRADELVRLFGIDPTQALNQWRRAEQEVWSDEESRTEELAHH
jgi:hypothetical protein